LEVFPGNSNKATEPKKPKAPVEKKIEKVTTGEVIKRKKPLGERFKALFLGADLKSVARYVAGDVLLPALKNMAVDTIEQGAKRAIYGDSAASRRASSSMMNRPRISYNSPIDRSYSTRQGAMLPQQPPHYGPQSRRIQNVGEIILSTRNEAELVLQGMRDILDQYESVSVADLYELVGLPSSHVDHTWGWTNLAYVSVRQIREGYVVDLPAAEAL
jgi:hypothetical protein